MELLTPVQALTRRFVLPDEAIVASAESPDQLLIQRRGCRIGDIHLLVPRETFGELVRREQVCELPNVATWCLGLVNVRGSLVPVFDLHVLLDQGMSRGKWLLVLGRAPDAVAITVDDLPTQVLLRPNERTDETTSVHEMLQPHLNAVFVQEDTVWLEPDYESLFLGLADRVALRPSPGDATVQSEH